MTHRWLVYGDYEGSLQMAWLRSWLTRGGVFVDSGANVGQYVQSLSHLPGVETFAFEPVANERDWLKTCLHRYPDWLVEVFPLALGADRHDVKIRLAGGKSTLRQDWYRNQQLDEEVVKMITLDSFAEQHGIERIRLWKLYMEGYEPQALAVAQSLLARQRVDALLTECQTSTIPATQQNLEIGKYKLFSIHSTGELKPFSAGSISQAFEGNLIALPTQTANY